MQCTCHLLLIQSFRYRLDRSAVLTHRYSLAKYLFLRFMSLSFAFKQHKEWVVLTFSLVAKEARELLRVDKADHARARTLSWPQGVPITVGLPNLSIYLLPNPNQPNQDDLSPCTFLADRWIAACKWYKDTMLLSPYALIQPFGYRLYRWN